MDRRRIEAFTLRGSRPCKVENILIAVGKKSGDEVGTFRQAEKQETRNRKQGKHETDC